MRSSVTYIILRPAVHYVVKWERFTFDHLRVTHEIVSRHPYTSSFYC